MAPKPIFTVTHPRACSTAFERVFMTRRDELVSQHEPFGDAFYFGPERVSERFKHDQAHCDSTGAGNETYKSTLDRFDDVEKQGKRVFIKDMAQVLFPSPGKEAHIAPSLAEEGDEPGNPTVIPLDVLKKFQYTFLIRHPRRSVPSYWRCTIPPLQEVSGWDYFEPNEMGYDELVRFFDYALKQGLIDKEQLTVVDADDLLDHPEEVIRQFCERTGIDFKKSMLVWDDADQQHAEEQFAKWNGFHSDVLGTRELKARTHRQKIPSAEEENHQWAEKYGKEAQRIIRETVDENVPKYEYLKQFCIKV